MSPEKQKNRIADFFRIERKRLINYVRWIINDAAERDGEDIVQDVMLNIFEKADITIPIDNLAAYIYRSLRNKVTDILRKKDRTVSLHEELAGEEGTTLLEVLHDPKLDTQQNLEKEEMKALAYRAIDNLPAEQQAVIIETELNGRSFQELSDAWGIPLGTLLARKSRAINKIRQELIAITT